MDMAGNENSIKKEKQPQEQLHLQEHQISFGLMSSHNPSPSSSSMHGNRINKETEAYELGEMDHELIMHLDGHGRDQSSLHLEQRRDDVSAETENIFPSQPIHVEPSVDTEVGAANSSQESDAYQSFTEMLGNNNDDQPPSVSLRSHLQEISMKRAGSNSKGTGSSMHCGQKTPDFMIQRRLAQNREAARKGRLKKKAYVEQLESSRLRLIQLEQEVQRARSQGMLLATGALVDQGHTTEGQGSDAETFDMEYSRWLEEHHRRIEELQRALHDQLSETQLRMSVDNCLAHYDELTTLRWTFIKSDVFHILSGMWMTPAERCFMWMGGFRPSQIIQILLSHIDPIPEQQMGNVYALQQSNQEAEEAMNQGLESLIQSLLETVTSDALNNPLNMELYMRQMATGLKKIDIYEKFVKQADGLRQHTLHRLYDILTTRQMARSLLVMADHSSRLRALSSLWLARPKT